MTSQTPKTFHIFNNHKNQRTISWEFKINKLIKKNYPKLIPDSDKPDVVIVLGGDGTIIEASRKYHERGSVILGLNLGHVGFLASVRKESNFLKALENLLNGKYEVLERMIISAQVKRKNKIVFTSEALNELVVKNPLGIVELEAKVAGHPVKHVKGTGILVSTATGST
ncbi:MAG: NAD(+)/NADH kinase, partial [Candidatus Yanofskybacteria bacterium]|nr:NAD(+)/NADH kinase [Candidatus Yanofskybacteria bacterium]